MSFPLGVLATCGAFALGGHLHKQIEPHGDGHGESLVPAYQFAQLAQSGDAPTGNGGKARRKTGGDAADDSGAAAATFDTVYALVKEHYVDALPGDRALRYGAVRSLLRSLGDPNSAFLEPEQKALIEGEAQGKFGGIGAATSIRAQKRDGYTEYKIVIASPLPGSPAQKAGLLPGDVVTHVDGKWVLGYDPFLKATKLAQKTQAADPNADDTLVRRAFDAARKQALGGMGLFAAQMVLKGDTQTLDTLKLSHDQISLTVERAGMAQPFSATITPANTTVPAVEARTLASGAGYVKINFFSGDTSAAWARAVSALPATGSKSGLVVDLRGNPGGLLQTAQQIEATLPLGKEGANAAPARFGYEAEVSGVVPLSVSHAPTAALPRRLVVLVDRGTASTAEAFALALHDRHGATLIGEKTFGDASVQSLYPLPDGSAFTLTTGKLLGPRKTGWERVGLVPTIALPANVTSEQVLQKAQAILQSPAQVAASQGKR